MKLSIEHVLVVLVLLSLVLVSANVVHRVEMPITRETAIEISRNTYAVQNVLNWRYPVSFQLTVEYWSGDRIQSWKNKFGVYEPYEVFPDDHGVWLVHWDIWAPGYIITHAIDELTGIILHESVAGIG